MKTYNELLREVNYLKCCLSLDNYVYAVCIGVSETYTGVLGCVKFLNGVDHWRSRDKMFANIDCNKYWALVDENVYRNYNNGSKSFSVR